jgi:hypothetical protein
VGGGPEDIVGDIGAGVYLGYELLFVSSAITAANISDATATTSDTTQQNNENVTYYHYSSAPPLSFVNGLWIGSSGTTTPNLTSISASQGLGIPPPLYVYPVTINPNATPAIYMGPVPPNRYGPGGYSDIYFLVALRRDQLALRLLFHKQGNALYIGSI